MTSSETIVQRAYRPSSTTGSVGHRGTEYEDEDIWPLHLDRPRQPKETPVDWKALHEARLAKYEADVAAELERLGEAGR